MKKPLHILWIPSWYPQEEKPLLGTFFQEQARALKEEGVQIGIIYPEIRPLKEFSLKRLGNYFQTTFQYESKIPVMRMHGWNIHPTHIQKQMNHWSFHALKLFEKYQKKFGKPQLIHAQSSLWAGIAAYEIKKQHYIPYCLTEHRDGFVTKNVLGTDYTSCWSTPFIQEAFDHAEVLIGVSEPLKRALSYYSDNPRLEAIPNSIDTDLFCPAPQKKKKEVFQFLTVGFLEKRKNVEMLLKAFKRLHGESPDVHLEIVGDGDERNALEKIVQDLKLRHAVSFRGLLSRSKVVEAFQRADAFVLASQNESFGVVCIEALATGTPIISTRCGGPVGIVSDDVGILVDKDDVDQFYSAMKQIKKEKERFDPNKIRTKALQNYSKKGIAQKHLQLYQEICVE